MKNEPGARAELAKVIAESRRLPYAHWRNRIAVGADTFERIVDGVRYQIEVEAMWDDKPDDNIRVRVAIDDGGWRAFKPLCDSFIVAANGSFVGE